MRIFLIAKLKRLRRHPVPTEALSRGRAEIVALMAERPMVARATVQGFAWAPVMAVLVVTIVLTPGTLVFAAKGALPGDMLYPVKIAVEEIRVAAAPGSESRYRLRSAQAERRLVEAELVIEREKMEEPERLARIEKAMDGYEKRLFDLNVLAIKASVETEDAMPNKKVRALEHLFEKHEELVASASTTGPRSAPVVRSVRNALELRSNIRELVETRKSERKDERKERDEDDDDLDARLDERAERLREKLETYERERDRREDSRKDSDRERDGSDEAKVRIELDTRALVPLR